ncbi:MAG: hypothetical protein HWE25_02835 [Alphaproteobacteria bacterium]|nr:hypothetical protein [Alphaproteobacteria bacterium]
MTYQAKKMAPALLKTALIGMGFMSLAACQHTDTSSATRPETTLRNSVQMVRLPFEIRAEDDGTATPSGATLAQIGAFLASVNAGYGDVLMLDAGNVAPARLAALQDFIRARGLAFGGNAAMGATPTEGSVMLYLERYVVTTPNCGTWPAENGNNRRNNPSAHFGCADTTNLGLMVANPRDLIAGQGNGNSTAAAVGAIYTPAPSSAPAPGNMTLSLEGMTMTAPVPNTGGGQQ